MAQEDCLWEDRGPTDTDIIDYITIASEGKSNRFW